MTNRFQEIIANYGLEFSMTEEDFEKVAQINNLLQSRNMKWSDVIKLIDKFDCTRREARSRRDDDIINDFIKMKGGSYGNLIIRPEDAKRPDASSTGIANELSLKYRLSNMGVINILKKANVWTSSKDKNKDKQK